MTPEIITIISTGLVVILSIWKIQARYEDRNEIAHRELGQRIEALDNKLSQRIEALDNKLSQRIEAINARLDTLITQR